MIIIKANMILKRKEYREIKSHLNDQKIIILYGPRQVGKSFILKTIFTDIKEQKIWLHGEMQGTSLNFRNTDTFLSYLSSEALDYHKKVFIFIDEFHHIPDISQKLKILYDLYPNLKFLVSGSSALSTNQNLDESLAGRTYFIKTSSLRYSEYLENFEEQAYLTYENLDLTKNTDIYTGIMKKLDFSRTINYGLYPEVILENNKEKKILIMSNIFNNYIRKDIKAFNSNINPIVFNDLLEILAGNIGGLVSINNLSESLKVKYSNIEEYLFILKEIFVVNTIRPFTSKIIKEIRKSPKLYYEDIGIRNFVSALFIASLNRPDYGQLIENFVWNELNKNRDPITKINFWRTKQGAEIDFVMTKNLNRLLIEVKSGELTKIPYNKSFAAYEDIYNDRNITEVTIHTGDTYIKKGSKILLPVAYTGRLHELLKD